MNLSFTRRAPGLLCALLLLLAAVIVHPVAEIGMNDDFSYIHTALNLARTGHIVYVGWASAMIGWQLALGALFAHLFGFSFTAVRLSNLLVACLTAFLLQRTLARAGLNPWNATLGTLAVVFSPLVLASTFSFMTDLGGLFCIVLCLYCCLRALESHTTSGPLLWLTAAALSNDIGGTVRQIVWLGVLVMVPCTCWLLRRRPYVLRTAALLGPISAIFLFMSVRWLHRQPYMLPETLVFGSVNGQVIGDLIQRLGQMFLDFALLLLPLLAPFALGLQWKSRRTLAFAGLVAVSLAVSSLYLLHLHQLYLWLAPFLGNDLTSHGAIDVSGLHSERPIVLPNPVRLLLSLATFAALCGFVYALASTRRASRPIAACPGQPTRRELSILLGPFLLAYFILLIPRGAFLAIFDRYLLIPFALFTLVLLRLYQKRIGSRLPLLAPLLIALFGLYGIATMHDVFSMYRARAAAIQQLRRQGVPANRIDGGFESNGWTEIEEVGYLDSPEIVVPRGAYIPHPHLSPHVPCHTQMGFLTPHVVPRFGLAYTPNACAGPANLPPVPYSDWLSRRPQFIYTIQLAGGSDQR